jgi:hypothetical protein
MFHVEHMQHMRLQFADGKRFVQQAIGQSFETSRAPLLEASGDDQDFQAKPLVSGEPHQIDSVAARPQMNIGDEEIEAAFIQETDSLFDAIQGDDFESHLAQHLIFDCTQDRIVLDDEDVLMRCHIQNNQLL